MKRLLSITAFVLMTLGPVASRAADVRYQVVGYGDQHAVVVLKGVSPNSLTASMSSDGQSIRLSGVQTRFIPVESAGPSKLVASAIQLKRGEFTDLVLSLSTASELKATPGPEELRLLIKIKGAEDRPMTDPKTLPPPAKSQKNPLPFLVSTQKSSDKKGKDDKIAQVTLSCPDISKLTGMTDVSIRLRQVASMMDLTLAWLLGKPLEEALHSSEKEIERLTEENETLEGLVKQLTNELTAQRQDLQKSDSSTPHGEGK